MRTSHYRHLALATLTSVAVLSPAVAVAGPDDGKVVATRAHIDAPKAYWDADTFQLRTSLPGQTVATEESVVWVGKGWGSRGQNQYQFTVPDHPALSFLGDPGDTVYAAPDLAFGGHDPVWLGFGADTGLPADAFRDGTASLDLLRRPVPRAHRGRRPRRHLRVRRPPRPRPVQPLPAERRFRTAAAAVELG